MPRRRHQLLVTVSITLSSERCSRVPVKLAPSTQGSDDWYHLQVSDPTCVTVLVIGVGGGVALTVWSNARDRTRREEAARRTAAYAVARGERITTLLEVAGAGDTSASTQRELGELLHADPIQDIDHFNANGGWFDRVAPVLRRLIRTESGAHVTEAYFRCFVVPAGHQRKVLEFLAAVLNEVGEIPERSEIFKKLTDKVVAQSTIAEARWLYERSLDLVEQQAGSPTSKAIALYLGRKSYALGRPDRTPTVYDEQAIANDISVRIRTSTL